MDTVTYGTDGDMATARREDFIDPQVSCMGFGATDEEALADLEEQESK